MARLVPNPMGDVIQPLQRVEDAIGSLSEELSDIHCLPVIRDELIAVNRMLATLVEAVERLGDDLRERERESSSADGRPASGRPPAPARGGRGPAG